MNWSIAVKVQLFEILEILFDVYVVQLYHHHAFNRLRVATNIMLRRLVSPPRYRGASHNASFWRRDNPHARPGKSRANSYARILNSEK